MKIFRRISCIVLIMIMAFSLNTYAMPQNLYGTDIRPSNPSSDRANNYSYRWTWLSDEICVQFETGGPVNSKMPRSMLDKKHDEGSLPRWTELDGSGGSELKIRDTYSGKWNQDAEGVWSFRFDDDTIPIDLTRIDGVLYAFNGYGELVDGYEYWNGQKTGPDGLATCTDPEFVTYLGTQYLPDCTSHK